MGNGIYGGSHDALGCHQKPAMVEVKTSALLARAAKHANVVAAAISITTIQFPYRNLIFLGQHTSSIDYIK
jgi:hypothetical protein